MQFGVDPQEFSKYVDYLIKEQLVNHFYLVNRLVKDEEKAPADPLDLLPTQWRSLINAVNRGDYGAVYTFQHTYTKPVYFGKYTRFIIDDIASGALGIFKNSKDKTKTLLTALNNIVYPRAIKEFQEYVVEQFDKQNILYSYTLLLALGDGLDLELFSKETLKAISKVSALLGYVNSNLYNIFNWQLYPVASLLSLMNISAGFKDYRVIGARLYYIILDVFKNVLEQFELNIDNKEYKAAQALMQYTGPLMVYSFNVVPYESEKNKELGRLHTSLVYSEDLKTWSEYFIKVVKELAKTTDPIIPLRPALKTVDKAYTEIRNALKDIEDFYT